MPMFNNWRKYTEKPTYDGNGTFIGATRTEVPRWSTEATVNFLRAHGRQLARNACRDGWHISLIDFVQHQHRLPGGDECELIVADFHKIEAATQNSAKRPQILETRDKIRHAILAPLTPAAPQEDRK